MNDNWFFAIQGTQYGPVNEEDLRQKASSGALSPGDLVWKAGMANWVAASTIPGLIFSGNSILPPPLLEVSYAGFSQRFCAAFLDGIILMLGLIPAGFLLGLVLHGLGVNDLDQTEGLANLLSVVLGWLYSAGLESSGFQATIGKMALGIKVTNLQGGRISFVQATGRHFGKIISGFILLIGFIMAAFTEKKQALHDIMAGTLVVRR